MPSRIRALAREAIPSPILNLLFKKALNNAWDISTRRNYVSHFKSYVSFVRIQNLDIEPNEHTLALYIVYMSQFIKPSSVETYLTGICHNLVLIFPEVIRWRNSALVRQTLRGCKRLWGSPTTRKRALTLGELVSIASRYQSRCHFDDFLFLSILLSGFFALLRLGEMVYSNEPGLDCPRKMVQRSSLTLTATSLRFLLPYHKADRFYEGNSILIHSNPTSANPVKAMTEYVRLRDKHFPLHPDLWVRSDGSRPRRNWFITRLRQFTPPDVAGHSLRAGGATALAQHGVHLDLIQALGRWSSESFRTYIRLHPTLVHTAMRHQSLL